MKQLEAAITFGIENKKNEKRKICVFVLEEVTLELMNF